MIMGKVRQKPNIISRQLNYRIAEISYSESLSIRIPVGEELVRAFVNL